MDGRKKAKQFNSFINGLRDRRNISIGKLCEGLCSRRMGGYLESGERAPDKLLQDRILERLGVGAEDYEYFLFYDEYDRWAARQRILHNITYERWGRAERLLQEYGDTHDMGNVLEKQFYLSMLAQIRRHGGEASEVLGLLFEEAVRLTVPQLGNRPLAQMTLCLKELNLILEAEHCREKGGSPRLYQEVMDYILTGGFDGESVAKLYPKAVYFLCRSVEEIEDPQCRKNWTDNRLLVYCGKALGYLRKHFKMYYLWEILDMRERLLERMAQELTIRKEFQKAQNLSRMRQENAQWKQALESIYEQFYVPKETFEYCYLYVVKRVSCINDVIRIRRQMFGMNQRELCAGICDIATLRRLERRETVPHREIAEKLFERLGLSTEFTKTSLITPSYEAKLLMEELEEYVNKEQWDNAGMLLERIEGMADMDIPHNRQSLMRREAVIRWHSGVITREEYLARVTAALELTLPCQAFYKEGEQYLTNEEQICIRNMMRAMDKTGDEYGIFAQKLEAMYLPYADNELQDAVANLYKSVMGHNGSWRAT